MHSHRKLNEMDRVQDAANPGTFGMGASASSGHSILQDVPTTRSGWTRRTTHWLVDRAVGASANEPLACAPLPRFGIHRILVCRVSHTLGNTLLITPLLRELTRVYPGAEIDILTRSPVAQEVFGAFDRVRTIFRLPRHGVSAPAQVASVFRQLRARHYDLAIDPGVLSRSDRVGVLAANATWKIGYATGKQGALSHRLAVPADVRHVAKLPVHLLRAALADRETRPHPTLDIVLGDDERAWGRSVLADLVGGGAPVLGIFTAATGTKQVGQAWWRVFATHHARLRPNVRIVEIIPLAGRSMLDDRFPTYFSTSIRRLASVLSALSLFVSGDCGVMHLGCAAGAPTIGLFQGTDIAEWGPYGPDDAAFDVTTAGPEEVCAWPGFDGIAIA